MATLVVSEAIVSCAAGSAPSSMTILGNIIAVEGMVGNISSGIPIVNISNFSECEILTLETAGAETQCIPATETWVPGVPTVLVGEEFALDQTSILECNIGGVITVDFPGQVQVIAAA